MYMILLRILSWLVIGGGERSAYETTVDNGDKQKQNHVGQPTPVSGCGLRVGLGPDLGQ